MVKEIERAGIPVVHMCTVTPISMTVGANRIVPTIAIPHPLGNPAVTMDEEKQKEMPLPVNLPSFSQPMGLGNAPVAMMTLPGPDGGGGERPQPHCPYDGAGEEVRRRALLRCD